MEQMFYLICLLITILKTLKLIINYGINLNAQDKMEEQP